MAGSEPDHLMRKWNDDNNSWARCVVLVVMGIVALVRRQILPGILLIVVGLLVGPGGVSIFNR